MKGADRQGPHLLGLTLLWGRDMTAEAADGERTITGRHTQSKRAQ